MSASGYTGMSSFEKETCKITIGGKSYTMAEYSKLKKSEENKEKKKSKRKKKVVKEIGFVALEVEKMVKPITILKSLSAYYDNAYRQWGTKAQSILNNAKIRPHFVFYRVKVKELEELISEIEKMARRNESSAYQFVEKIAWKLEDIKKHISDIVKGAEASGLMELYKDEECVNGNGRRLGLKTLVFKSFKAVSSIEEAIEALKKIAEDGTDPLCYGDHLSYTTRRRCWA